MSRLPNSIYDMSMAGRTWCQFLFTCTKGKSIPPGSGVRIFKVGKCSVCFFRIPKSSTEFTTRETMGRNQTNPQFIVKEFRQKLLTSLRSFENEVLNHYPNHIVVHVPLELHRRTQLPKNADKCSIRLRADRKAPLLPSDLRITYQKWNPKTTFQCKDQYKCRTTHAQLGLALAKVQRNLGSSALSTITDVPNMTAMKQIRIEL